MSETRPAVRKGSGFFARLPQERQQEILGLAKFAALMAGAIKLEDVAGFRRDPRWGVAVGLPGTAGARPPDAEQSG